MWPIATAVVGSVCLSVCPSVCHDHEPAKTAEPIEVPFGLGGDLEAQGTMY